MAGPEPNQRFETAVLYESKYYPEARLRDIYKNFFQDPFGPGHLIPDTTKQQELVFQTCIVLEPMKPVKGIKKAAENFGIIADMGFSGKLSIITGNTICQCQK